MAYFGNLMMMKNDNSARFKCNTCVPKATAMRQHISAWQLAISSVAASRPLVSCLADVLPPGVGLC
jgi:hypothetical protein